MEEARAREHAEHIAGRVRALAIHHPRSRTGRYLSVCVGVVTVVPPGDRPMEVLLEAAKRAVRQAKELGGNRVVPGGLG